LLKVIQQGLAAQTAIQQKLEGAEFIEPAAPLVFPAVT